MLIHAKSLIFFSQLVQLLFFRRHMALAGKGLVTVAG